MGKKDSGYLPRFSVEEATALYERGIEPEQANAYRDDFTAAEVIACVTHGVTPEASLEYPARLTGSEIVSFIRLDLKPDDLNKYPSRFDANDIMTLLVDYVRGDVAAGYSERFSARDIATLYRVCVTPGILSIKDQEDMFEEISMVARNLYYVDLDEGSGLIDLGRRGVVLHKDNVAVKFSEDLYQEYLMLKRVQDAHRGRQKNVVRLMDTREQPTMTWEQEPLPPTELRKLKIERIIGSTLEKKIAESLASNLELSICLPVKDVIKYSADICNGILEMRVAGVYHGDIHTGNIVVDAKTDNPVIVDLGTATTDPDKINPMNRAFGGNNDLLSLGQIIYKMYSGSNLFNEGEGNTRQAEVRDGIKVTREKTYDSPQLKAEMLAKVRKTLPTELSDIAVMLLDDDLWTQPDEEKVRRTAEYIRQAYLSISSS